MSDLTISAPPLAVGSIGRKAFGWWGMLTIIMTEGALFGYLLFSYYYFALQYGREWLPEELPKFHLSAPNTALLLLSSVAAWWSEHGAKRGLRWQMASGVAVAIVLGAVFIVVQAMEWHEKPFTLSSSSYGSIYFIVTGFHMAHVLAGEIVLVVLLIWTLLGYFDAERHAAFSIGAFYWHFVDAVWLTLFFTFYITPRLG